MVGANVRVFDEVFYRAWLVNHPVVPKCCKSCVKYNIYEYMCKTNKNMCKIYYTFVKRKIF